MSTTMTIRVSDELYEFIEMESKRRRETKNAFVNGVLQAQKMKTEGMFRDFKNEDGVTLYEYLYSELEDIPDL